MTDIPLPSPAGRKPRMPLVKPASAHEVWDELEQLARAYRQLTLDALAQPPDTASTAATEDPERARLRQRIWQLMAGTWVQMVADDARAAAQEDGELDDPEAEDEADPSQRRRRGDSALRGLFRTKAQKLAQTYGDWMIRSYGGPTNLSASVQSQFVVDKMGSLAGKRKVTMLSALLHEWNPAKSNLQTFLGVMAENFLKSLARCLDPDKTQKAKQKTGDSPQPSDPQAPAKTKPDHSGRPHKRHTLDAYPIGWVQPEPADDDQPRPPEARPIEDWADEEGRSPEELTEQRQLLEAVWAAADHLSGKDKRVFQTLLVQIHDDLTDEEAAQRAGMDRVTYTRHRNRLRQALKQQLG